MNRESMLERMEMLIEQNLEVKLPGKLTEASRLYDDLHIDSIMVLQLIVYLEEEFNVVIPEEGIDPEVFETVGVLLTLIETLLNESSEIKV